MAKLYGIGASVVLIGALFKLQHWAGASTMLIVGLTTEAIIFFFSAFEPLHEELDWTLVYPELAGITDPDELDEYKEEAIAGRGVTLEKFDDLFQHANIKPEAIEDLGKNMESLKSIAGSFKDISEASVATKLYMDNVKNAADSVTTLTNNYAESTDNLSSSINQLSESYNKTAGMIHQSGTDIAQKFVKTGDNLSASYTELAQKMKNDYDNITAGNKSFGDQLENLNKNLNSLNSAYEKQLKDATEQTKDSGEVYKGIGRMLSGLKESVNETLKYKEEVNKLSKSISELNTIYGNMLSALSKKS